MPDKKIAIAVKNIHKDFVLPQHKNSSFKQAAVNIVRENNKTTQRVLDGVSFDIQEGDFFAIVGRNGSGKSTLLKLLAGVYSPTEGEIEINGGITPFIELGVGFNPELSGRDNVYLNGALLGFNRKQMDQMYDQIVDFAELEQFMDQKLKNYSSGMQVRLAFSVAIRAKSEILLLDEVLAVGDAAFQQKCFNYFEELKREKQTVVFVSHDMGAVRRFCTRAVYISAGKLIHDGTPGEVADLYAEANMNTQQDEAEEESPLSDAYEVKARIVSQDKNLVKIKVSYKAPDKEKVYATFVLTKDGISIGAIATSQEKPLAGSGEVFYNLDTSVLNPGIYRIEGTSLSKLDNREIVAIDKHLNDFLVKGDDVTRGGALRLEDTWHYGKD
jgi:ABC-2 type transport system ATP-binding protein